MTEDEIRELMGYGGPREIEFAGQQWKIRDDILAPLLTYAKASLKSGMEGDETEGLAALHLLLEGCLVSFGEFSRAAYDAKADLEDIQDIGRRLVEVACARGFWPSMRLLGYIIGSMDEFDGLSLKATGRGIAHLSAREACNLAMAICLEGRDEEDRQTFFDDLNYEGSPDAEALVKLREYQAQQKALGEAEVGEGG